MPKTLVCASANAKMVVAGTIFGHNCARCGLPVMIAPTGQRLIAASLPEDPVEIICGTCFFLEADPTTSIALAGSVEDHAAELATIQPNLHRTRN